MNIQIFTRINGALIMALSSYVAWLIAASTNAEYIKGSIKEGYKKLNEGYIERRLQRQAKEYTRTISTKMSVIDKVEIFLIDKSNIRRFVPFMNFYVLLLISLLVFVVSYISIYGFLKFSVSSLIISGILFFIPAIILQLMGAYNSEHVRRRLGYFISVIREYINAKEDIIYAFERSVIKGKIAEPLRSYINDTVIQVRLGMDPQDALDLLKEKVSNPQFSDFILNIKQNIRYRGDLKVLLCNMENQFSKLEEEFNRRKISTFRNKIYIVLAMAFVIIVAYMLIRTNPKALNFYTNTTPGKLYLTLFAALYASGFYMMTTISRFKH